MIKHFPIFSTRKRYDTIIWLSAHANLDIIRYQSRDGIYTVLKGSGFVKWWGVSRFEGQPHRLAKPLPFETGYITSRDW
jgi:hypothetical protein